MTRGLPDGVRRCCIPDCTTLLPRTHTMPVCRPCGIKIAVVHIHDAEQYAAVKAVQRARDEAHQKRRDEAYAEQSVVYYVRLGSGRIKIGYTTNLRARLIQLRLHEHDVLATEPGGRQVEAARHNQFRSERMGRRHEDFDDTPRLATHIADIRAQHGPPTLTGYIYVPRVDQTDPTDVL